MNHVFDSVLCKFCTVFIFIVSFMSIVPLAILMGYTTDELKTIVIVLLISAVILSVFILFAAMKYVEVRDKHRHKNGYSKITAHENSSSHHGSDGHHPIHGSGDGAHPPHLLKGNA